MTKLMDPGELASDLKIPEATLAQWRYRGIGPAFLKVGRHVRYRAEDVADWLNGQTHRGDAA
jgi:predicted site-specific integrase-resolvase